MQWNLRQMLVRWIVLALGVLLATKIVHGISCDSFETLVAVVLVLSFLNAILRPVLLLFTLPFIVLTLGAGILIINALLFLLVGNVVAGFHVSGFWAAFGGAIVVSITNFALGALTKNPPQRPRAPSRRVKRDDAIDI